MATFRESEPPICYKQTQLQTQIQLDLYIGPRYTFLNYNSKTPPLYYYHPYLL